MYNELREICKQIIALTEEAEKYIGYKAKINSYISDLDTRLNEKQITKEFYNQSLKRLLKDYKKDDLMSFYNEKLLDVLDELERKNSSLLNFTSQEARSRFDPNIKPKDIGIDTDYLKEVVSKLKGRKSTEDAKGYSIYEANFYGKIANNLFDRLSLKLIGKYPNFFSGLLFSLKSSDIRILSKTYINSMLLTSLLTFIMSSIVLSILIKGNIIIAVLTSLLASFLVSIIIFSFMYYYPYLSLNSKKKKIKDDLPFVVMHMSAIAGSGAQPIAMFNMILDSDEYIGLKGEIKKILNYVNLMGYDLNTALKNVALTTPSKPFSELLNGIVTTTESGGSLKEYLDAKASDLMENYRLERKKFVETISTYSDIYTGILIAAPLLFFVTIAIIQLLGGEIFGLSIKIIAIIGTYIAIPLLNMAFLLFLNSVQVRE